MYLSLRKQKTSLMKVWSPRTMLHMSLAAGAALLLNLLLLLGYRLCWSRCRRWCWSRGRCNCLGHHELKCLGLGVGEHGGGSLQDLLVLLDWSRILLDILLLDWSCVRGNSGGHCWSGIFSILLDCWSCVCCWSSVCCCGCWCSVGSPIVGIA